MHEVQPRVVRVNRLVDAVYSGVVLRIPWLHATLLRLLRPDKDVAIEIFGSRLEINKRKESYYWRAYRLARSSPVLWRETGPLLSLALVLQPGDTFVDVGANVGLYSSILVRLRRLQPTVRFYAFEANPDTAKRLKTGLPAGEVTVIERAVSDHEGMLTFAQGSSSLTFGVARNSGELQLRQQTVEVPALRLDQADIRGDSLVLKIDVENHEREVLAGASGLFAAGRIKAVYLDGYADAEVPRFLSAQGFALFDGRTLAPGVSPTLLAVHGSRIGSAG
jgi:FkbM family methyltransferase